MRKIFFLLSAVAISTAAIIFTGCSSDNAKSSEKELASLKEGFNNPPKSTRLYVWWHWMNGNITKDGIKKDLEWMDRAGIAGFHHFDAAISTPTIVEDRLIYMHDDWKDAFHYAVGLADSLGLEVTVASSPGWSTTGGPWVEPKDAMKKVVWRTVDVQGGKEISLKLPEPYTVSGMYQNMSRGTKESYYEDIEVVAVKQPGNRKKAEECGAKVTSSGGNFTLDDLVSNEGMDYIDKLNFKVLPFGDNGEAWIQYSFPEKFTVKTVQLACNRKVIMQSSDDGVNFNDVAEIGTRWIIENTQNVPETTAKYFRFVVKNPESKDELKRTTKIAQLRLLPYTMVNYVEGKAGFTSNADLRRFPTAATNEEFPTEDEVIILDEYVDTLGNLKWNAPEGNWKIYRFGYSLTGKKNHPAPVEATGLEVDKLDPVAWNKYFQVFIKMYKDAAQGLLGDKGIQYILTDSYEAGEENWTPAMFDEFAKRRGYDMRKWLPAIAGEVIDSPEKSDAFLRDWILTIEDLYAANYDQLTEIIKNAGMKGRYSESHEGGRAYVVDGMDVKRTAQIPMSATWDWRPHLSEDIYEPDLNGKADCKESSSVAHIYGQNIAAAESMTVDGRGGKAYAYSPEYLKIVADREMSSGINRFVVHESAHQPDDVHVPGMSLGQYGQWFNRHETWAEMARTWSDYIARSCFMLQAGQNVADILYYYGENTNITAEFMYKWPGIPSGYQWDYCNPDALLNHISCKDGDLTATSGVKYKLLWMDRNMEYVSVAVLRKIAELVHAGAVIGGVRPQHPSSLMDDMAEFDSLVKDIWDSGRPNVHESATLADCLNAASIKPQVELPSNTRFLHRSDDGVDIFWINRPSDSYCDTVVVFNLAGKKPQIWHPDNGLMEDASYKVVDGKTVVNVHLVPNDAIFVVFAGKDENEYAVPELKTAELATVAGPWQVTFQEKRGAPESAVFEELKSFTESEDPGIKYFSGVAAYSNKVDISDTTGHIALDLGSVKNIAEVSVNGVNCGRAWKEPFVVDITSAVRQGENQLEIKVADLWVNRIIGDLQPSAKEKVSWVDYDGWYDKDSPLLPAGLLGPVKVIQTK